jgi:hypothetical protein
VSAPGMSSILDSVAGVVVKHRNKKCDCKKCYISVFATLGVHDCKVVITCD